MEKQELEKMDKEYLQMFEQTLGDEEVVDMHEDLFYASQEVKEEDITEQHEEDFYY